VRGRASVTLALVVGGGIALAAGLTVLAQPASNQSGASGGDSGSPTAPPPGVPVIQAPPEVTPPSDTSDESDEGGHAKAATNSVKHAAAPPPAPPPPPALPKPVRSPTAVMQALDKVTAETMRFAVPVGQPVRYKNLVFVVKACESTGLGQASPQSSAYVVIDLAPAPAEGYAAAPPKQVFKGWMFASSPGLNPFQHPVYDAWLITCIAAAPAPAGTPAPPS
jgi:hypothetical protein